MNQISFTGQLTCGPATSTEDTFPSGASFIPYATNPDPKPVQVNTGDMVANVSTDSFVALAGLGANQAVTQCTFLYLRSNTPMQVRTTDLNGNKAVETIKGLKVVEYDPNTYIVLIEVLGSGVVEYLAAGPA